MAVPSHGMLLVGWATEPPGGGSKKLMTSPCPLKVHLMRGGMNIEEDGE